MFNIGYSLLPIRKLEGLHCHSLLSSGITQNITAIEWCNHCSCSTRFIFPSVSNWRLCSNRLLFFFSAMWLWNVAHGYRVHWGKKNGCLQVHSSIRHPHRPAPRRPARLPGFPVLLAARWRQILQVNIRWKALDEIYKIYMPLHRSDLNISEIFRQKFSHFLAKFTKIRYFWILSADFCSDFGEILSEFRR